jgi:transposase
MQHLAIDLGSKESQICVRQADEKIIAERLYTTSRLGNYLKRQPPSRVILETCAEAFGVADTARQLGHDVRVVPATLVRSLGVGARGIKTDKRDARVLSEVSCRIDLPSVHIPSRLSRELKSLCGMREALVHTRTHLINSARGYMRTRLVRFGRGSVKTFTKRSRNKMLEQPDGLPASLERMLLVIEELNVQIDEASKELEGVARANDTCRRLMTAPGVGPISAVRFLAAIDEVGRFPTAHALESYLGLTPGERSSSQKQRRTSITKAGAPQVRWTLGQACWNACRWQPHDPLVRWAKQVADRRGRAISIVAMTRKLAGILYALWRDGTTYNPLRLRKDSQR